MTLRILHLFDHSLPLQSGYVTRSLAILRSQHARGWTTVHLTSPRHQHYAGAGPAQESFDGLVFNRTPHRPVPFPGLREIAEMRSTAARLAALVRAERPDVIHAHSPVLNAMPALAVGRRLGIPVVYEVRAFWEDAAIDNGRNREGSLRYGLAHWLDTRAMRRAGRIVALCEPLRQEILSRGIAAERVSVVPNAVDPAFLDQPIDADPTLRRSLNLEGKTIVGFIGSFYAYEGLDLLLEAVQRLAARQPHLAVLLVGGGPEDQLLRDKAKALGIAPRVVFTGRVPLGEVMRYYALIDLFVFPRRRMRLTELVTPLKPLEAMARRRPVLASDVGGHRELIRHGETGFLFPPDDPDALAAAIEEVLSDPARLAAIVANGRRFVAEERNWTAVCARYAAIYEALVPAAAPERQADMATV